MIAENDDAARSQLAAWIEDAGFLCAQTDADGALTEARRHPPDVAVVGVTAPDDGGMWVLRALRSQAERVGVVAVSTPPDVDVAVATSRLGAIDCLPWPTSQAGVVDAVRRAANWHASMKKTGQSARRLQEEVTLGRARLMDMIRRVDPSTASAVLLAVLEARAPDTFDHSQRVARSSVALSTTLGLSPSDVETVRQAALFHDIGKVALPKSLLACTEPPSEAMLSVLRTHVVIAREALALAPGLEPVSTVVAATHERFDGGGYPAGLAGTTIPQAARIIAVANAYDAMISTSPHTDPLAPEEARAELVRAAGGQFDPDIVRAWMQAAEVFPCS